MSSYELAQTAEPDWAAVFTAPPRYTLPRSRVGEMQVFAREPSYALAPDGRIHFAPGYDYVINSVDQAGRLLRSVRYRLVVAER